MPDNVTTGTTTKTGASALPASGGTSASSLSEWVGPYVTNMLGQGYALSQMPYQAYKGPMTAGTSPLQTQAFQGLGNLTLPNSLTQAQQVAGNVATQGAGAGYTPNTFSSTFQAPDQFTAGDFQSTYQAPGQYQPVGGSFTDQGVAQQYMNPYMQQVLDPQMQAMQRQADIQRSMAGAQAAKQGAFGGARAGLMGQQIGAELMRQQQQATGQAYQNAYQNAQQQYNTEQARKVQEAQFGAQQGMTASELMARYGLSAQQAREASRQFGAQQGMQAAQLGAQYGLSAQQLGEQARQYGADFGLRNLAQQLSAAQTLGQLGTAQGAEQRANLAQQLAAGQQQRAIEQEGITADYNEFLQQRDYPQRMVQFQQSLLQGLPIGTVTNTPTPQSTWGKVSEAAGGLGTLYETLKKMFPDTFK